MMNIGVSVGGGTFPLREMVVEEQEAFLNCHLADGYCHYIKR